MQASGLEADVVAYGAAMAACARRGKWMLADRLYFEMVSGGIRRRHSLRHGGGRLDSLLMIGGSHGSLSRLLIMTAAIPSMPTVANRSVTRRATLQARICVRGQVGRSRAAAFGLFSPRRSDGGGLVCPFWVAQVEAGLTPDTVVFNTLLHACQKGGAGGAALDIFQRMGEAGVEVSTVHCSAPRLSWTWCEGWAPTQGSISEKTLTPTATS